MAVSYKSKVRRLLNQSDKEHLTAAVERLTAEVAQLPPGAARYKKEAELWAVTARLQKVRKALKPRKKKKGWWELF